MLWFTVWTVLVLGTLGGAFLVGRRLWRSAVALHHELERAGDVAARLESRAAELEEQARAAAVEVRPALGGDVDALRLRREQVRAQRRDRRDARRERHRGTVRDATARWYGAPADTRPAGARPATTGDGTTGGTTPLDS